MSLNTDIVTRADHDFYPTPPEAVRALLSVEQFDGPIWEPACGDGAISRELEVYGHRVLSTDLINRGFGQGGCDFLSSVTSTRIMIEHPELRHVVTNPPYSYQRGIADKFVGQALRVTRATGGKVAMLLNLGSLAHPSRTLKWRNNPPAAIYTLDELVCWPNGNRRQAGRYIAEHRYCWVVWRSAHDGPPRFWWLRTADFRQEGGLQ
jgi:predicted RNA methylase